jgi:hypothetical protein
MTTFAIQTGASDIDKTGALNYVLNNVGQGLQVNAEYGTINVPNVAPNTIPYAWAYPYLYIAFANSFDGNLDFSQDQFQNKLYIGFWNTNELTIGGSQNPSQYVWFPVAGGGFSTTKQLYYSVRSGYQLQIDITDSFVPPLYDNIYLWRDYTPLIGSSVGLDLTWITNATNVGADGSGGTLAGLTVGMLYVLDADGPDWVDTSGITVQGAREIEVSTVIGGQTYSLTLAPQPVDYGENNFIEADDSLTYQTGSTATSSILTAPNIQSNALVNILPQSSEPDGVVLGSITVADAVTWDPATASTTTPYVAFYNGTAWTKLG